MSSVPKNVDDEYEEYNYNEEKFLHAGSGKQRSKKEASEHTNHHNPGGHERKLVTKMINTEHNHNKTNAANASSPPKRDSK